MEIRLAHPNEVGAITKILEEAKAFLAASGSSQRTSVCSKSAACGHARKLEENSPASVNDTAAVRPAPLCQKATSGALYSSPVTAAAEASGLR